MNRQNSPFWLHILIQQLNFIAYIIVADEKHLLIYQQEEV